MGSHPVNLAVRFILELVALGSAGFWGWHQAAGWQRYLPAMGIPIVLALIWVTFAVHEDPSRSGNAPVPVPGILRLLIELGIFAFAVWALYDLGHARGGMILGIVVALHYAASYDRVIWLLGR